MNLKQKLIVIVGPTTSGKSDLAITLAKALGGEVVSADSRQVYKGLNIGTGKVTKKEMAGIPHHLLDVASPKRVYTASDYVKAARKAIADIHARGKVAILCGGTGFYIDTLLGRMNIPEVPPNPTLRKKLDRKTVSQLYAQLLKKDPARAKTIDRHNPVRLIRALEIVEKLGKVPLPPMADLRSRPFETVIIGIRFPQALLQRRIHTRLLARMKKGMLREAKRLHNPPAGGGLSWKRMEELGLEYRYMARHLQGKITKQEMVEQLESEIVKYSKRQMTWFRRHEDVVWVEPSETGKAVLLSNKFLKK